jgi:8-oxo-dGTP pyrophosphatase MutT (NUDIX family)
MNEQTLKKKVQVLVIAEAELLLFEFNNQLPNNYVGFQNITGSVEGEESFLEGALRELQEEAGISAPVIDLNLKFTFNDRWKNHCEEKVYLCHLPIKPKIVLNEEHLFCKWIPLEEVRAEDYTFPSNFEAFLAAKELVGSKR